MNNIFDLSLAISLFLSGGLKIAYFKYTKNTIFKLNVFPEKIAPAISILMPLFEISQSIILILYNNMISYCFILGYLLFFIALNLKTYKGGESKECCCYGKLIKSKLGLGGLIHYSYWLIILFGSIAALKYNIFIFNNLNFMYILFISLSMVINGLMIRSTIESVE
ncbi:MauE/DoxX family redox-associated membrane protein [Anaerocolumna chitinilytica]|uniref:Methylamine utilisation protein MauE domain-containing protein n=1 Tax=Anaerocolumna chitinilytica TaxID=1727145 RepID=A0A7I8DIN0_9FIRM|nr:MauE/DoxX family redox-associated membrane protein [Anaerocolumna chitinilytica]BCJ98348.1 hypothetical protein bsdcttw_13890 [Anaerocolumna chitinilytica]